MFSTQYSNDVKWPLKKINNIKVQQTNFQPKSNGKYKYSYMTTFDCIDTNDKKWICKELKIDTNYFPKRKKNNGWYINFNSARNCYAK